MNNQSSAIEAHLQASRELIAHAVVALREADPEAYQAVSRSALAGGSFRVTTGLSPAGLCEVHVDLVTASGEVVNVGRAEFQAVH